MKFLKIKQQFSFWPAVALKNKQMTQVANLKQFTNQEMGDKYCYPLVFDSAEEQLANENSNNEYLPIEGLDSFIKAYNQFTYGKNIYVAIGQNIAGCQVLGNTGALRLGFELVKKFLPSGTSILFPNEKQMKIDILGLLEDLKSSPQGTLVVFHACAHNPYGCDLDKDQ